MPSIRPTLVAAVPPWAARGACRSVDPDLFYTDDNGKHDDADLARALCRRCPTQADCLRFALAADRGWGIWGGHDPRERRQLAADLGLPELPAPGLDVVLAGMPMPAPPAPEPVVEKPVPARRRTALTGDALAAAIDAADRDGRTAQQVAAAAGCSRRTVIRRRGDRRANTAEAA